MRTWRGSSRRAIPLSRFPSIGSASDGTGNNSDDLEPGSSGGWLAAGCALLSRRSWAAGMNSAVRRGQNRPLGWSLVCVTTVFQPATYVAVARIAVGPVDDAPSWVPFILTMKLYRVSRFYTVYSWRQVNVVGDQ